MDGVVIRDKNYRPWDVVAVRGGPIDIKTRAVVIATRNSGSEPELILWVPQENGRRGYQATLRESASGDLSRISHPEEVEAMLSPIAVREMVFVEKERRCLGIVMTMFDGGTAVFRRLGDDHLSLEPLELLRSARLPCREEADAAVRINAEQPQALVA